MCGVRHLLWYCAGQNLPLLTGNVVSLGLSLLITVVGSLIIPGRDFDWKTLNKITKTEDTVSPLCSPALTCTCLGTCQYTVWKTDTARVFLV